MSSNTQTGSVISSNDILLKESKQEVVLNDALELALKKYETEIKNSNIIMRCEALPKVEGSLDQFRDIFEILLSAILIHPHNGSNLFLFIDCNELKEDTPSLKKGLKSYRIGIHTNIRTDEEWISRTRDELSHCERTLNQFGGSLTVNNIYSTGCLFVISLPGKI